jgi:hypothetical protein
MRSQPESLAIGEGLHSRDVSVDDVEVDEKRWSVEFLVAWFDGQHDSLAQRARDIEGESAHYSATTAVLIWPKPRKPSAPFSRP